ncbi:hypothetical protein EDB81DRAFT_208781 [Dactylonectria macrodidyma]|uniref:Uncharacterized protein n=1 Tax=Dactylonectria macrodidyma TaxID=307937 RepID=A0A9P9IMI7_9HYPO|nr:hypothetical protein EDB81DRAFT_208781 [Dactylonectria macrodidyma]
MSGANRCEQCDAVFARPEHMRRHQVLHSRLRPYHCAFCGKSFARSDVARRHHQTCKSIEGASPTPSDAPRRVNRACDSCRRSKVKCSGTRPCSRCDTIGRGHLCQYTLRKPRLDIGIVRDTVSVGLTDQTHEPRKHLAADHVGESMLVDGYDGDSPGAGQNPVEPEDDCKQAESSSHASLGEVCQYQETSNSLADSLDGGATVINSLVVNPSTYFDLDLLDWGILDHSFLALAKDDFTEATFSEPHSQPIVSPAATVSLCGAETALDLPAGIGLMQISPLEAHRSCILAFLRESNQRSSKWEQWFSLDNMSLFIRSYFKSFHQHTPLLHLASWSITTCRTSLVFAMLLMGAMYTENFESNGPESRRLCRLAETYAWTSDPSFSAALPAELESIQAVYIVTLLDAFYFPAKRNHPHVDTKRLMEEARKAGVFDPVPPRSEPCTMSWAEWSKQECRIRTAFILYLFDAARTVLFNQHPELRLYELCLPLPCDESVLNAGSEEEWREMYRSTGNLSTLDYPVVLSLFMCEEPVEMLLDLSVMGAFTVLHGM